MTNQFIHYSIIIFYLISSKQKIKIVLNILRALLLIMEFDNGERYVRLRDRSQETDYNSILFGENIKHITYFDTEGDIDRMSVEAVEYIESRGIDLDLIEVKNIGTLSLEERNNIKDFHRKSVISRREKALEELIVEYGDPDIRNI